MIITDVTVTRDQLVEAAREWLDVGWQHQGRTRHGIDCLGLPSVVALARGLVEDLPRIDYPQDPDGSLLPGLRASPLVEIPPGEIGAGDIPVFSRLRVAFHVGIAAIDRDGQPSVIHAYKLGRKVREERIAEIPDVLGRITHGFRFPQLAV